MQRIIVYHVKYSSRFFGGFAILRVPCADSMRNKFFNKRLRKARKDSLKFTRSFSDSQRALTFGLVSSLDLIPACGMTDAYLKSCHDEYYEKWITDVAFRILFEERQDEIKRYMSQYGLRRRVNKVNSFNKQLELFAD